MGEFKLMRGYESSILRIPKKVVSTELLTSLIEMQSMAAMERLMHSIAPHLIESSHLPSGTDVLVYYKSSVQSEANE